MLFRLLLLSLLLGAVLGQDATADAGAADDGGDGEEGGEGEEGEEEECEESWEYVEFLKTDVNEEVTDVLEGLYEIRNNKNEQAVDNAVSNTMQKVLEIREKILDRIFKLRKNEIAICEGQNVKQEDNLSELRRKVMTILLLTIDRDSPSLEKIKEISDELVRFRTDVNAEVMRVIMLPEGKSNKIVDTGDCTECDLLESLTEKIDGLIDCADGADQAGEESEESNEVDGETAGAGAEEGGEDGGEEEGSGGGECMPPGMYSMELLVANSKIDKETESLYPQMFTALFNDDNATVAKIDNKLKALKNIREQLEEVVTKISKTQDEAKLRKLTSRSLAPVSSELNRLLKECKEGCGEAGCNSCGAEVLTEMIDKLKYYKEIYNRTEEEPTDLNEEVRRDLMKYIESTSEESNEILLEKIEGMGDLSPCDQQKLDVYNKTKNTLWMLVNTTIFTTTIEEPLAMVEALEEMLNLLLQDYCTDAPRVIVDPSGPSCNWEEYEQTGEYITKIDEIIQNSLFKPSGDDAKKDAQVGFLDVKKQLDKRLSKLFNDGMICPEEVKTIKEMWMPKLGECLSVFMNPRIKFSQMTRMNRITCTKGFRTAMEIKRTGLLQSELSASIDQIGQSAEGVSENAV